jgi:hypothetical protein
MISNSTGARQSLLSLKFDFAVAERPTIRDLFVVRTEHRARPDFCKWLEYPVSNIIGKRNYICRDSVLTHTGATELCGAMCLRHRLRTLQDSLGSMLSFSGPLHVY